MKTFLPHRKDTLLPRDVEQMLRDASAWEPDAEMPSDFADFTRQALVKHGTRGRKIQPPRHILGAGLLRSPLTVGLASACILWAVGSKTASTDWTANVSPVHPSATASGKPAALPDAKSSRVAVVTVPSLPKAVPMRLTSRLAANGAATRTVARNRRRNPKRLMEAATSAKPKITPPIGGSPWKTETVERPAWGALVPMTVACSLPGAEKEHEGEATATLLPVVMDVALPDMPGEGESPPSPSTSTVN